MKRVIPIVLILLCLVSLVTVPGQVEYLQLRYFKGIKPENVEAAVMSMDAMSRLMKKSLGIETHITAEEIRKFDGESIREFISELNRSIDVEQEFAFLRSLDYYVEIKNGSDLNGIRSKIIADLSEDYYRLQAGPSPETNDGLKLIESIAEETPELKELINERANK